MSLSARSRKKLRKAFGSTAVGNELADMMGGVKQQTEIKCMKAVTNEVKEVTQLVCPAVVADKKEISQVICPADLSKKERTQIIAPAHLAPVKEITQLICVAETSVKENTQMICPAELSVKEITQLICPADVGVREATQILARADVGDDTNGKYFVIWDNVGSVAVWMENGAGAEPAHGCDRSIKVTTIATNDLIGTVGTKLYNAIAADSKFDGVSDNTAGTIVIRNVYSGVRIDGSNGTSGMTISQSAAGVASNYDAKFFKIYDEVGSIGVWFDVDNKGTTAPAGALACDRQIAVTTVTSSMAAGALGTALYTVLVADAKFDAHNDNAAGTIQVAASLSGVRTLATAETSPITPSSHQTGVASNYDGTFLKMYDEVGSVGVWFDVDNRGTTAPAGALACARQIEITTVTNGMAAGALGTAIYNALDGDAKFVGSADNAAGTIKIQASLSGVRTASSAETSPIGVSRDTLGVASNYDGKFVKLYDDAGSVAFWFDVDNRGTAAPVHGCDRAVEINTVNNGMVVGAVGTAIYNAIVGDAKFDAHNDDLAGTIQVEASVAGTRAAASAETSPLTPSSHVTGRFDNYHELFFKIYDEVGSVGCWFDIDDAGGAAPAGALACDRQLEINNITTGMTAGQAGTAIYSKLDGDAKFLGISDDTAGTIIVESTTYGVKTDATAQTSPCTVSVSQQGVDSNYNQKFFKIYDEVGSVGVWFDVDAVGGAAPAGALGCARQIKVDTITSTMAAGAIGTAIYTVLEADAKFEPGVDSTTGTFTIQQTVAGVRPSISAQTSPCTVSVTQEGSDNYSSKTFVLYDEVGSVGFWFDIDNAGATIPAAASACDRAVEITTVNTAMTAGQAGTAIYNAIVGDAKFDAGADDAAGTISVTSSTFGAKTDGNAGTSAIAVSTITPGADSDYDGDYIILKDDAGTVGVWFDIDNLGTVMPAGAAACDRQIKVETLTSGMTAIQAAAALETKLLLDAKFVTVLNAGDGSFIVESSAVIDGSGQATSDAVTVQLTNIVIGKTDGGTLSAKAQKLLQVNLFGASYTDFKTAVEAGTATGTLLEKTQKDLKALICDNKTYNEIIALY